MLSLGFPPLISPTARILVLGSLPGGRSIETSQYYANSKNAFWSIAALYHPSMPKIYSRRAVWLARRRVAIWDVLAGATRAGSLDANIAKDAIPNNFRALFHVYPNLKLICFNGDKPSKLYRKFVMPKLSDEQRRIAQQTLPSTSSARASMTLEEKARRWRVVWQRAP